MNKPAPQSVLGLDIGHKKIGLAGCDPLGITVTRLPALFRKKFETDLIKINFYCRERDIKGLIIGIPLDKKGRATSQSELCKRYGLRIAKALQLPIALVNEQCTTWEAKERLNLPSDRSGKIDSEAAGLLIEQWLKEGPELLPENEISYSGKITNFKDRSNSI